MPEYSPLLAVVTGLFEFGASAAAFLSSGRKRILRPVSLILLLLAGYQFSEVAVCSNPSNLLLSRIAFLIITWLPPLSLWLLYQLSSPKNRLFKYLSLGWFVAAAVFAVWIVADTHSVTRTVCDTVIARYENGGPFDWAYGIFYQSGLAVLIFGAATAMVSAEDVTARRHLANLQTGVLGFVLPAFFVRLIIPEPEGILPSVMCHFALVLAVMLAFLTARESSLKS